MSDVEKISTEMMILATAIVKFGKAMAEVGSKNTGKDIIKKTFSKMSDMLNVAPTSQPAETSTLLDDDPIFNDESFLAAVSALEKAFIVTTNLAEHPKEAELDGLPSTPSAPTTDIKYHTSLNMNTTSSSSSFFVMRRCTVFSSAGFVVIMNAFSNADTAARKLSSLKIGSSSNNVEVSAGWEVDAMFSISDILLKVFLIMSFPVFLLPTSVIAFPNLTIAAANIFISVDIFSTSLIAALSPTSGRYRSVLHMFRSTLLDCGHQMCAHCVLALCCHNKPDPKTTVAAVPLCPFCRSSIAQLSSIEVKGGDSEQDAYSKTTMKARRSRNMNEGSSSFKGLSSGVGSLGRIGGCGAGWERLQLKINGLISPQALILSSEF
nr:putative E3 ubiquitin-protein ligase XBAT31 [Ipomoea batatas]